MKSFSIFAGLLFLFNISIAQEPVESADKIMAAAYKQAAKEHKNVIVIFHASWCGWCHKMEAAMNDETCKEIFADNFVTVHLTVEESEKNKSLENPGAEAFKSKYHGEKAGLPFWLILDSKENLLGDSYIRAVGVSMDSAGDNIGCPAEASEVAAFVALLKKTSTLNDNQLDIISTRFKKNKS